MPDTSTGVVVIGGGSTGAGVLRDLALRGVDAILVEKGDLASGTTGRSHGLLHSGGRYCVNEDRKSTRLNSSHSQISYAVFCLKKKISAESTSASVARGRESGIVVNAFQWVSTVDITP